jgi:hypothetical protein
MVELGCAGLVRLFLIDGSRLESHASKTTTGFESLLCKPPLVHLKDKAHRFGGAVRVGGLWLHIRQIHDGAIVRNEGGSQW